MTIDSSSYLEGVPVAFEGQYDEIEDGQTDTCIKLTVSSPDSFKRGSIPCIKTVEVEDTWVPMITSISPSTIPLLGGVVTVNGERFSPNATAGVIYGGGSESAFQPTSVSPLSLTSGGTYVSAEVVFNSTSTLLIIIPPSPPNGNWTGTYQTLQIDNSNGMRVSCPSSCPPNSELFFTEDCPEKGQYGSGLECKTCPTGGVCPGGYRLWPKSGYWVKSEFSKTVSRCAAPADERCIGGRFSECGAGYTGEICGECSDDYFSSANRCEPCRTDDDTARLVTSVIVPALLVFFGFAMLIAISSNRFLDLFVVVFVTLQQAITVGRSASPMLDSNTSSLFQSLQIFLFDFNFIRPGCSIGKIPFSTYYIGSLFFVFIVYLYFLAFATIFQFIQQRRGVQRGEVERCSWREWLFNSSAFKPRQHRATIVAYHITYLQLAVRTLQLLNCEDIDVGNGKVESRLIVEPSQVCYSGAHLLPAILAWLVVLPFLFIPPVYFFAKMYKNRSFITAARLRRKIKETFTSSRATVLSPSPSPAPSRQASMAGGKGGSSGSMLSSQDRSVSQSSSLSLFEEKDKTVRDGVYVFDNDWGFLIRDVEKKSFWWFRLLAYPTSFAVALDVVLSDEHIVANLVIAYAIFMSGAIIVLIFRPMKQSSNYMAIALGVLKILTTVLLLFLANHDTIAFTVAASSIFIITLSLFLAHYLRREGLISDAPMGHLEEADFNYRQQQFGRSSSQASSFDGSTSLRSSIESANVILKTQSHRFSGVELETLGESKEEEDHQENYHNGHEIETYNQNTLFSGSPSGAVTDETRTDSGEHVPVYTHQYGDEVEIEGEKERGEDGEEEESLPAGWVKYFNDEGVAYYYNAATDESRWEPPSM